jgi:hypothetical protein
MKLFDGLARIQNLLNIRYERMDPGRLKTWRVEPAGLRIEQEGAELERIPWDDVSELVTFKRDYGATDQVCLGFRRGESDAYAVLEEDNPAWLQVLAEVEERFQLPEQWFDAVMDPPFECNWTTLWGEPPAKRQSG